MNWLESTPTADEIEQYKADWKRRGFLIRFTDDNNKANTDCSNNPTASEMKEHDLWKTAITEAIADAQGSSALADEICVNCHQEAVSCDCAEFWFTRKHIIREHLAKGIVIVKCPIWTNRAPGNRYILRPINISISSVIEIEPGIFRWRAGSPDCKQIHTYRQCARNWFASRHFEEVCGNLQIDVGWFRKQIAEAA